MIGDLMYYLNLFLINSIIGFFLETGLKFFIFHGMNNGILFGPWIPVYGFGTIIITFFYILIFKRLRWSKLCKTIILFFTIIILLTLLEWFGGIIIEAVFDKQFWNYRNQKYNFGPYISLGMSLLWGFISILFVYVILPLEERIIKKIPRWFSILVLLFILFDCLLTCWLI